MPRERNCDKNICRIGNQLQVLRRTDRITSGLPEFEWIWPHFDCGFFGRVGQALGRTILETVDRPFPVLKAIVSVQSDSKP